MSKNVYTILIVPQRGSSVKKINASSTFIKLISVAIVVVFLSIVCFSYDYIRVKKGAVELASLKQLTSVQKGQIDLLAGEIDQFEKKLEDLKQFDKKIRIMANLEDNQDNGQILGIGGPIPEGNSMESQGVLIGTIHKHVDNLLENATYREKSFRELLEFLGKQKSILASTPSIWPVMGWVTSEFGYRTSPFTGKREFHRGIDIATRVGKEIVAPADGIAVSVCKKPGMGNMVKISHKNSITTCYGHLLKSAVKRGKRVKRGDVIGYVGNSGRSTGPHLHYGVYLNGVAVNPRRYLF